ncbi:hypothetical protein HMPREF9103_03011 [Lentilactobacillus parafarraginis F0439]|uniref:Uncharacterized protein n=1 Tax=Lentilactobacillus parafarraginis F0439 TaxID=797515 RepID=G9ZTC7_9LACO|nr:hypothetical protein HMPREF9103_03011 [Lentilactobacillus parafarraginis F0439]
MVMYKNNECHFEHSLLKFAVISLATILFRAIKPGYSVTF